jgi:hypothetical protein
MPTSLSEWACLLVVSTLVGAAVGAFARRLPTVIVGVIVLQFVAAPLIYYAPPLLEHRPMAEYQAWQFLIIPMIAIQSAILSFLAALLVLRLRRVLGKRGENI